VPRAPSEIVDEICGWLRPGAEARDAVLAEIAFLTPRAAQFAPRQRITRNVKEARARKRKAERAIRIIHELGLGDEHVPAALRRIAEWSKTPGPDPRFDTLRFHCAHGACALIECHGKTKPVGTAEGNTHDVTRLIYEAVKGRPPSESSCLKAVKSALAALNRSRNI
jgi:hypothetical protein